jgi:glycosyltransferase involved in cell wall biosynthesis
MFGPICATGASSAKSLFDVVHEWVKAGHQIDFFSLGTWIDPAWLVDYPNFRYTPVPLPDWMQLNRFQRSTGPTIPRLVLNAGLSHTTRIAHERLLAAAVRREHATRNYDAFVMINRTCSYPLDDLLPVVSWSQAPPGTESDFIVREPALSKKELGLSGWAFLRGGYVWRDAAGAAALRRAGGIIASSYWAKSFFERHGVTSDRLRVLPFPVNVDRFRPAPRPATRDRFAFLWLGRIVPRKRLPLALEALDRLRRRRPSARLMIVGGPGYGGIIPRYHLPSFGDGVEALAPIPQTEVPSLFARTDVVLQPSENESFGSSGAEALASGIPSVLGPTNGTSDVLADTAFRFTRYEPEDVAAAMERAMDAVLADPEGVAVRARATAEKTVALPVVAAHGVDVVREFIDRWHAARP